ncbi:MAG: ATP-binding protein [Actinomycetota bacterium]|nr:ATP-binding protein [Actinomycetota bacterium]
MLEILEGLLDELGLPHAGELLPAKIEAAMAAELSYGEFLRGVLEAEASVRRRRSYETRLRLAGLPHRKGLSAFDFDFAKGAARVNLCETESLDNHCAVVVASSGRLIHAADGRTGGSGCLRTKRSG